MTLFTREQLEKINGASNEFYGWGGEDDDLWNRVQAAGMTVVRAPISQAQFYEANYNHERIDIENNRKLLRRVHIRQQMHENGLKQVQYTLLKRIDYSSFVWMLFSL